MNTKELLKYIKALKCSLFFELALVFRNKLYYIIYLPLLYFLYYSINDGITSLTFSAYVVQTLILGCMLIGFQNVVREEREKDKQILILVPNRYLMLETRTIATQIYVIVINIVLLAEIYLFTIIQKTPLWIRKEALVYWFLYFIMPSLIAVMIGQIIAMFGWRKVSYIIMLLIGISIGPLGKEFLEVIATILNTDSLRNVAGIVTIGQYDAHEPFNYLYGYEIESKRIWHRICYLLITEVLWNMICWWQEKYFTKRKFYIKKMLLILLCLSFSISQYNQVVFCRKTGIMEDTAQVLYDYEYYSNRKNNDLQGEWLLKNIKAVVNAKKALEVIGTLDATLKKDTSTLTMSLYHDLELLSITLNGSQLIYTQSGDFIEVQLGELRKSGETLTLAFHYKGLTSPYYYAGEKAVYLPGYYNWLPYPGKKNSFIKEAGYVNTNPVYAQTDTEYLIQFESNSSVYSNLCLNNGVWSGLGGDGVTFISGNLKEIEQDGIDICVTMDKSNLFVKQATCKLIFYIDEFRAQLGLEDKQISKIIFIPTKNEKLGKYSGNTMVDGNTVISGVYEVQEQNDWYFMREALIGILAMDSDFIKLEKDLKSEFVEKFLDAYEKKDVQRLKECKVYFNSLNQSEAGSE